MAENKSEFIFLPNENDESSANTTTNAAAKKSDDTEAPPPQSKNSFQWVESDEEDEPQKPQKNPDWVKNTGAGVGAFIGYKGGLNSPFSSNQNAFEKLAYGDKSKKTGEPIFNDKASFNRYIASQLPPEYRHLTVQDIEKVWGRPVRSHSEIQDFIKAIKSTEPERIFKQTGIKNGLPTGYYVMTDGKAQLDISHLAKKPSLLQNIINAPFTQGALNSPLVRGAAKVAGIGAGALGGALTAENVYDLTKKSMNEGLNVGDIPQGLSTASGLAMMSSNPLAVPLGMAMQGGLSAGNYLYDKYQEPIANALDSIFSNKQE